MKKAIITASMFIVMVSTGLAQKAFDEDTKTVSLGVGFGSPYWSSYLKSSLPVNPTLHLEKSLGDGISVGSTFIYSSQTWPAYYDLRFRALYLGGRAAYHFEIPNQKKLDLYAGAGLGYAIVMVSTKSDEAAAVGSSGIGYALFGGGKYYFARKAAIYAELGYGSFSILNAGIALKIK